MQMCLESKNMVLLKSLCCLVLLERVKCSGVEFFCSIMEMLNYW